MTLLSAQKLRDSLLGKSLVGEAGVRFHLRTLLGEGGQGWVFKANYDDPDGFWIVVKMLRHVEGDAVDALRRFEREAKVLQMLGSVPTPNPNIVRFYDHGVLRVPTPLGEITLPFMALEFVDGPTLAALIEQHGGAGLPLGHALSLMKQVARALGTVHEHRIVHRDLKPSNILLATVQGQQIAKVTDFGLVKVTDLSARSTATVAGATLGYAPPEQYEMGNNRVSAQTDIFSYATILFEVLSGQIAFPHKPGDSPLRTVARMLTGERPQLARFMGTLSPELRGRPDLVAILDRELARATHADPSQRHANIFDLWTRVEPAMREALRPDRTSGAHPETRAVSEGAETLSGPVLSSYAVIGLPLRGDTLRSAAFAPEEGTIYGLGARALHTFSQGAWSPLALPALPPADAVKGLARLASGELLVLGDGGLAMAFSRAAGGRRLLAPDVDVTWYGAHTEDGDVILVGERRVAGRTVGLLGEVGPRGIAVRAIEGTTRLVAVTRIASGTFVACGAHGALVHVLPSAMAASFPGRPAHEDVPWGRTGHLTAICRSFDGGAFAVGTGGHALAIRPHDALGAPPPPATLETVQTTRDLTTVVLDASGTPWAAGGQARLLVREEGKWIRVPMDLTATTLVAISMRQRATLVAEDGTVIEGRGG